MGLVPSNGNQDFVVSSDGRERNWGGGSDRVTRNILKFASLKRRAILSENFFTIRRPVRLPLPISSRTCDPNMFWWHVKYHNRTSIWENIIRPFQARGSPDRRQHRHCQCQWPSFVRLGKFKNLQHPPVVQDRERMHHRPPSWPPLLILRMEKAVGSSKIMWWTLDELELCDVVVRASPSVRCSWVRANDVAD